MSCSRCSRTWNPRLREHLTQMASLARAEEEWWQTEVARLAPQVVLPGKPVRGGGGVAGGGLAIDLTRFAGLATAMQRRMLRYAAGQLGAAPDFAATEALRGLALNGRTRQKSELEGLHAERTARELRLEAGPATNKGSDGPPVYCLPVPGELEARAFGLRIKIECATADVPRGPAAAARLRSWAPGDRARLRYSGSPRKVKEILERMRVSGSDRAIWPVLELDGRIVWMKGVELEPEPGLTVRAEALERAAASGGGYSTDGG